MAGAGARVGRRGGTARGAPSASGTVSRFPTLRTRPLRLRREHRIGPRGPHMDFLRHVRWVLRASRAGGLQAATGRPPPGGLPEFHPTPTPTSQIRPTYLRCFQWTPLRFHCWRRKPRVRWPSRRSLVQSRIAPLSTEPIRHFDERTSAPAMSGSYRRGFAMTELRRAAALAYCHFHCHPLRRGACQGIGKPRLSGAFLESRRSDLNRGPLHYE